jgi:hypothetical protein
MSLLILFRRLTGFFKYNTGKRMAAITLIFPVIFLISCGLPSFSYLFPPTNVYTRIDPDSLQEQNLIFSNAYQNLISIFTGYEIYYKIYDPLSGNSSEYSTDITSISNTTGADYNTFNSNGFHRLYFTTGDLTSSSFIHNESKPAFKPDSALLDDDFKIRFNLRQDLSPSPSYLAEPFLSSFTFSTNPSIYRWVNSDASGAQTVDIQKQFSLTDFDIYDSDLPSTVNSDDLSLTDYYFYITFYIMSFGRDAADITSQVYSEPIYLGTLKFNCNLTDNFYN